ncbi:MAG TPA: S8 family serine peptidase [Gemmatimonadales bacterium]
MKPVRWCSALILGCVAAAACTDDVPPTAPEASVASGHGVVTLRTAASATPQMVSLSRDRMLSLRRAGAPVGSVVPLDYVPGQAIVRFAPGSDAVATASRIVAASGGSLRESLLLDRAWVVDVPTGHEASVAAALAGMPGVEFAEPDYLLAVDPCETGLCETPNDGFFGYKWDLHNDGTINNSIGTVLGITGRVDADIDWLEMYQSLGTSFGGSATIGIIDTGIRDSHQDLVGRVVAARNFAIGYPETLTEDRDGHGTHVAGIAAARTNNGLGVAGVAYSPNIRLISAKSCELYLFPDGVVRTACPTSSTADAVVWAVDNGADVLNLSLGGDPAATAGSALQKAALAYARANDVLPFCATGNDNFPGIAFPARFPECVAVGATNWSDERASYSNFGAEIDLSAPGGDLNPLGTPYGFILSLDAAPGTPVIDSYLWMAGTSMATPQVVGLAAMLRANGMGSADAILARLRSTADDLGPAGWDPEFGYGRVNAFQAVTGRELAAMDVQPSRISVTRTAQVSVYLYSRAGFDATAVGAASVRLYPGGSGDGAAVMKRGAAYMTSTRDYDGDGRTDRMLMFSVADLRAAGLDVGTTQLVLRGTEVEARDATPPVVAP